MTEEIIEGETETPIEKPQGVEGSQEGSQEGAKKIAEKIREGTESTVGRVTLSEAVAAAIKGIKQEIAVD